MMRAFKSNDISGRPPSAGRRGTSSLDLLVAFTLLTTVISFATPLVVRHGRLLKSHRDYRLALDEVSNQLDRLAVLPAEELPGAVESLAPSDFVTERLAGAKLTGELAPAETGSRLTLKLTWNETGRENAPVTMAAWVFPRGPQPSGAPAEDAP